MNPTYETFCNVNSPLGKHVLYDSYHDADKPRYLDEQRGALRKVVLSSPRKSPDYYGALFRLMYTESGREELYGPMENAEIDKMLDVLYLVSVTRTQFPSTR